MPVTNLKTLDLRTRARWREWLRKHHRTESEIWLVFHKRHTGAESIDYDAAVEEALCFGWVDSLVRRLDAERYARKFTPRTANSRWSAINRRRYADLKSRALLEPAGLARPPTAGSGAAPRPRRGAEIPSYIENGLKANARAWETFEKLAPSYRRSYVGWIDYAKKEETKAKRLREAVRLLAKGEKLGLK
jgi:uncharacterized protein YdeI (YjbR/CyaY-like superfamily)